MSTSRPMVIRNIKAIAVAGNTKDPITPCGICRQFIREFAPEIPMYMFNEENRFIKVYLQDLLPLSFGQKISAYRIKSLYGITRQIAPPTRPAHSKTNNGMTNRFDGDSFFTFSHNHAKNQKKIFSFFQYIFSFYLICSDHFHQEL